ncbi:MAG: PRTRC system protein B [Terriglobales bacterium]
MTSHVRIGDNRIFTLKQAVLLYQDGSTTFATLHQVKSLPEGAPYLGAGQSVTTGFLERLARGLGASLAPEVLSANILSRTPELIAWWTPEKHRLMFFGDGNKDTTELNGRMYPHPALVFMLNGRELLVRALGENRRPTADTRLKNAPYWNTDAHGRVCLGSMRVPKEVSADSLSVWEDAYFASEFTHPSGAVHLTPTPAGFLDSGQSWQGETVGFQSSF